MWVRMVRPGMAGVMDVAPHNVDALIARGWAVDGPAPVSVRPRTKSTPKPETQKDSGMGAPRKNASRKAWAEYAESVGVDPTGLTRNKIQEALDAV